RRQSLTRQMQSNGLGAFCPKAKCVRTWKSVAQLWVHYLANGGDLLLAPPQCRSVFLFSFEDTSGKSFPNPSVSSVANAEAAQVRLESPAAPFPSQWQL